MSTVLTFQVPNGRWAYAVSPNSLSIGGGDFLNRDDALEAAKRVIEREGWKPLPPPSDLPTTKFDSIVSATSGVLTIAKGVMQPLAGPMLRIVGDDE